MDLTKTRRLRVAQKREDDSARVAVKEPTYEEMFERTFSDADTRLDKRKPNEHRPIFMSCGVTEDCRGSSYVEMGATKVMCGVVGPLEIANQSGYMEEGVIRCEISFASLQPAQQQQQQQAQQQQQQAASEERMLAKRLQNTLDAVVCRHEFPNFQITVSVLVLEKDGPCFPAAVSAASLALADARLPMHDLVSCVSLGLHGDRLLIDLTEKEEFFCSRVDPPASCPSRDRSVVNIAYMSNLEQIVDYYQCGALDPDSDFVNAALDHCRQIVGRQQRILIKSLKRRLTASGRRGDDGDDREGDA